MKPTANYVKASASAVLDLVMPRVCVICGRELSVDERTACGECLADIPRTYFWLRERNPMADRFNASIGNDGCYEPYCRAAALFFYSGESLYSNITKSLKYHRCFNSGEYFGTMLGRLLAGSTYFEGVDLVVPVPLHWTRRFKRGYNQAEIIASAIAKALGAPMGASVLKRSRRTVTQTHISRAAKAENLRGAFSPGVLPQVAPHHILLVDDVFTTGATLAECHRALRQVYGPSIRISAATLGCAAA